MPLTRPLSRPLTRSIARGLTEAGGGGAPELPAQASLLLDLNAAIGVTTSGADVTAWADQSPQALTASGIAAKYPQYDAVGGVAGGPAVVVTGGQCMTLSAALRATSGPVTVMAVLNDTSNADGFRYLIDASTGRRMIEQMNSAGQVAYYDGASHRGIGLALRGPQCLTWTLQTGNGRAYRGRQDMGGNSNYTEGAWGGSPVSIFSDRGLATQFCHGKFDRILVWDKVLSAAELTQAWSYIQAEYGVAPALPDAMAVGDASARFVGPTTDGAKGVTSWAVTSAFSSASAIIEILLPASYTKSTARRWPVLYVLPALEGPPTLTGDGQAYIRALGWHSTQGCIVVQVAYPTAPWWGNHASDATKAQRRYLMEVVMPFIEANYQAGVERSGRNLIGYSKSGCGAFSLLIEHPDTFGYATSWDAPLMLQTGDYGIFDTATAFGNSTAWDAWRPRALLTSGPVDSSYDRLIIAGDDVDNLYGPGPAGAYTAAPHTQGFADHCTANSVQYAVDNTLGGAHDWSSGWPATALAMLVTAKDAGDAIDPPTDSGNLFA